MEFILSPWPWYVAGPLIAFVTFLLLYFGKQLGVSSSFRTMCAASGAGKYIPFFSLNMRDQMWNMSFVLGIVLGGILTAQFLTDHRTVNIAESTISDLQELGVAAPDGTMAPVEIFSWEGLTTTRGMVVIILGGFLVGFGTRYAGGCTSGHSIMGLSNLQLPSLIATIGFFVGGLTMTHLLLPHILNL